MYFFRRFCAHSRPVLAVTASLLFLAAFPASARAAIMGQYSLNCQHVQVSCHTPCIDVDICVGSSDNCYSKCISRNLKCDRGCDVQRVKGFCEPRNDCRDYVRDCREYDNDCQKCEDRCNSSSGKHNSGAGGRKGGSLIASVLKLTKNRGNKSDLKQGEASGSNNHAPDANNPSSNNTSSNQQSTSSEKSNASNNSSNHGSQVKPSNPANSSNSGNSNGQGANHGSNSQHSNDGRDSGNSQGSASSSNSANHNTGETHQGNGNSDNRGNANHSNSGNTSSNHSDNNHSNNSNSSNSNSSHSNNSNSNNSNSNHSNNEGPKGSSSNHGKGFTQSPIEELPNHVLEFSVKANSGKSVLIEGLSFKDKANCYGPQSGVVQYSFDGFETVADRFCFDISTCWQTECWDFCDFVLKPCQTVDFRFILKDALNWCYGEFCLANVKVKGHEICDPPVSTPEPGSLSLAALALFLGIGTRYKARRRNA